MKRLCAATIGVLLLSALLAAPAGASVVGTDTIARFSLEYYSSGTTLAELGAVYVRLRPDVEPEACQNFLTYVQQGAYDHTVLHRYVPGFVIQGGGYKLNSPVDLAAFDYSPNNQMYYYDDSQWQPIVSNGTIQDSAHLLNSFGTLAMAKTNDPNSATSQWYFNLADNTNLDGNYTVFGEIVGTEWETASADNLRMFDDLYNTEYYEEYPGWPLWLAGEVGEGLPGEVPLLWQPDAAMWNFMAVSVTLVPEPVSLSLLAAGGLALLRRRK